MVRIVAALLVATVASTASARTVYYPGRFDWQHRASSAQSRSSMRP